MSSNFCAIHAAIIERDYDNLQNKREKLLKHFDDIYCKLREISETYHLLDNDLY